MGCSSSVTVTRAPAPSLVSAQATTDLSRSSTPLASPPWVSASTASDTRHMSISIISVGGGSVAVPGEVPSDPAQATQSNRPEPEPAVSTEAAPPTEHLPLRVQASPPPTVPEQSDLHCEATATLSDFPPAAAGYAPVDASPAAPDTAASISPAAPTPQAPAIEPHPVGVSISFVRQFVAAHKAYPGFADFTTSDVCANVILSETAAQKCAYIDLFTGQCDESGRPLIGPATVFVSHAWKFHFADPVDVMEQHAAADAHSYFWFDLFVNNQNAAATLPQEWWKTTFRDSIRRIGTVLLVLAPWSNPIPITRAWCLWEIMCALGQDGVRLVVRLPTRQSEELLDGVVKHSKAILQALADIQAEKAEAFKPSDREMIFQTIRDTVGFEEVNIKVKDQLRSWFIDTLKRVAHEAHGRATARDAKILSHIGVVFDDLGFLDDALRYYGEALKIQTNVLGPMSHHNVITYNDIGEVYDKKGNKERAIDNFHKALAIAQQTCPEHPDTARIYNNIGMYEIHDEHVDQAVEYFEKSLAIQTAALGDSHRDVATVYNNLGLAYSHKGDYVTAIEYHKKALDIRLATVGPNHPETATTYSNLGSAYGRSGMFPEAVDFQRRALDVRLTTLGEKHVDTAVSHRRLASALVYTGQVDEAFQHFQTAYAILVSHFGRNNPRVAHVQQKLGMVHSIRGESADAIAYFKAVLQYELDTFGEDNMYTATAETDLAVELIKVGDAGFARDLLTQAVETLTRRLGADNERAARARRALQGFVRCAAR